MPLEDLIPTPFTARHYPENVIAYKKEKWDSLHRQLLRDTRDLSLCLEDKELKRLTKYSYRPSRAKEGYWFWKLKITRPQFEIRDGYACIANKKQKTSDGQGCLFFVKV